MFRKKGKKVQSLEDGECAVHPRKVIRAFPIVAVIEGYSICAYCDKKLKKIKRASDLKKMGRKVEEDEDQAVDGDGQGEDAQAAEPGESPELAPLEARSA